MDTHRAARIGNLATFAVAFAIVCAGAFVSVTQPRSFRAVDAIEDGRRSSRVGVITPMVLVGGTHGSAAPLGGGLFLTAWHVLGGVTDDVTLTATGYGKDRVPATVVWSTRPSDLALLYAPMLRSAGLPLRCSNAHIGERVLSMGWPARLPYSEAPGVITSAPAPITVHPRYMPPHAYTLVQWSTAPLGHGMSGGPTVDMQGRLVGINVLGVSDFYGIVAASEICRALGRS